MSFSIVLLLLNIEAIVTISCNSLFYLSYLTFNFLSLHHLLKMFDVFGNAKLSHCNFQLKNPTQWQLFWNSKHIFTQSWNGYCINVLFSITYLLHLKVNIFCALIIQWNSRYQAKNCCCSFLEWQKSVTTLKSSVS